MIADLGFLSSEAEESEKQIIRAYTDLFQLSGQLSKLFISLLRKAGLDRTSIKNLTINALAAKSLELFQSSIILLRKGCVPAANITCRALIETVYKLCAIQLANGGIDLYIHQEKLTRLQKLRSIQKYKQKHPGSGIAPGINTEIDALSKEKSKKTGPYEWASLAKMEDFHNLYYQGMSDDTHANIESLNHYFDQNSAYILSFGPSDEGLALAVVVSHRILINAIEKFALFQNANIASELAQLSGENDVLEGKYGNGESGDWKTIMGKTP
jgi:hypothetical protein